MTTAVVIIGVLLFVVAPLGLTLYLRRKRLGAAGLSANGRDVAGTISAAKNHWKDILAVVIFLFAIIVLFVLFPGIWGWMVKNYLPWGIVVGLLILGSFSTPLGWYFRNKRLGGFITRIAIVFVLWMMLLNFCQPAFTTAGKKNKYPMYVPDATLGQVTVTADSGVYKIDIPVSELTVSTGLTLRPGQRVLIRNIVPIRVQLPPIQLAGEHRPKQYPVGLYGSCIISGADTSYISVRDLPRVSNWDEFREKNGHLYLNDFFIHGSPLFIVNGYPHMRGIGHELVPADSTQELLVGVNLVRTGSVDRISGFYRVTFSILDPVEKEP